jgi:hypothetical protein
MFTAAHSWFSRRFSMFVLCILFVFVLCLYPMITAADTIHRTKKNKIHNTNIENRRDNQEWSAVNIGYNTQNEYKQNTQHKHRKLTGQPGMGVPSVFLVCVVYFVFLRSVYCIQCLQLPIPGCPVGFLCLCCVFCLSSFCVLYPMFTAAHSWNIQNEDNQNTQHKHWKLTGQPGMGSCKHWIQTQNEDKQNTQHKIVFVLGFVSNVYSCPFLVVPSVFYVCVVYFVCLRSVYCIQCLQLTIPGCPLGFLCLCC